MARTNETTPVLTSFQNNANNSMTQSSWSFLFNDISPASDGQLSFRGVCCCIIGLVSIGCQATLMSKLGKTIFTQTFYDFELFGSYLLALGIFVILLYHHKVYTLISVFILSFYELINLIRIIITYSIIIANWDKGDGIVMSNDSDSVTIKALIITCLICACFGLILTFSFMNIISDECKFQSRHTPLQQQMTSVTYTNPVAAFPTG